MFENHLTPFFDYLTTWQAQLPKMSIDEIVADPSSTAVLSVDVINGFCVQGPLASTRVARIIEPITRLFTRLWGRGIRQFLLLQDAHDPQAIEFNQWPVHCVRQTVEAETVAEIRALPFYGQMLTFPKNSINAALAPGVSQWLSDHPETTTFIVVGDCTDLCTYQLAMYLRLDANSRQRSRRVIIPADCVDTYDLPVEIAQQTGGLPHPAGVFHPLFLYHMAMNGVEVVRQVC